MWYISFLPLYLPTSPFLQSRRKGVAALAAWILSQVIPYPVILLRIGGVVILWIPIGTSWGECIFSATLGCGDGVFCRQCWDIRGSIIGGIVRDIG